MATTKSRTRKSTTGRKQSDGFAARTGRAIRERPYASAAIATGAVTAVAAAAAGAFFFRRSDKSFSEISDDFTSKVKDGIDMAKERFRETADGLRTRFADGNGSGDDRSQEEIAEEAMTLKSTGKKPSKPADPVVEGQTKAGATAH